MWRNFCINDTYEPGSTFKTFTTAAALEEGVLDISDSFYCPGYRIVEDRKIRCHKVIGHGSESFKEGIQNSCNPVFMDVGQRLGVEKFYKYFQDFGLMEKTGVDLPGEAGTIMHKQENVGPVELATISFGQSFQITPLQLATMVSSFVNGGTRVTPHFGIEVLDGKTSEIFEYEVVKNMVSSQTSETMQMLLESVISVTDAVATLPVLRPCVGLDKEEIVVRAREIAKGFLHINIFLLLWGLHRLIIRKF